MARRKLNLTAEERRERERQRSQSRRRRQQPQIVQEASLDPTIRIIQVHDPDERLAETEVTRLHAADLDNELGTTGGSGQSVPADFVTATLDARQEHQEDDVLPSDEREQTVPTDITRGERPSSPAGNPTSRSPSLSGSGARYNLRERKSPTPPTGVNHQCRASSLRSLVAADNGAETAHKFLLSLRPAPDTNSGKPAVNSSESEGEVRTTSTAYGPSTHRERPLRTRRRIATSEEADAGPLHESEPIREPNNTCVTGDGTRHELNESFVRSVIVVSTPDPEEYDDTGIGHDVGDDDDGDGDADDVLVDDVDDGNADILNSSGNFHATADESGLFVSDESWVLGDDEDVEPPPTEVERRSASAAALAIEQQHQISPPTFPRDHLEEAVAHIESTATRCGRDFIGRQAAAYRHVFEEAFALGCSCESAYIIL